MNIDIEVMEYFGENVHHYEGFSIRLIAYTARISGGKIELKDHEEYAWINVEQINTYQFAPADVPLVERLI